MNRSVFTLAALAVLGLFTIPAMADHGPGGPGTGGQGIGGQGIGGQGIGGQGLGDFGPAGSLTTSATASLCKAS